MFRRTELQARCFRPMNPDVERTYVPDSLLLPSTKVTRMVIAVKDNSASLAPYIFRTYNHVHAGEFAVQNRGSADNVRIVDVARATTAAPTYFKEQIINEQKYLDGGFCTNANNPSQIAWKEVLLMHGNNPQAVAFLVSIGTGKLRNR